MNGFRADAVERFLLHSLDDPLARDLDIYLESCEGDEAPVLVQGNDRIALPREDWPTLIRELERRLG